MREGVELHTPVVGELRFVDEVISAELTPDSRNAMRVRLVRPMKGWATLRCFEQIESAESYAASVEGARLLECERREELNRAAIEMQRQRVIDERTSSSSTPAATSVNALQDNQQRRGETSYYYAHYDKDVTIATTPTKIEPQQHGTSSAPDDSNDALRNNLRLKGMASYYYAHSRKDDGICFETAPQKLDRAPSDEGQLLRPTESIMDYSFSDEAERVVRMDGTCGEARNRHSVLSRHSTTARTQRRPVFVAVHIFRAEQAEARPPCALYQKGIVPYAVEVSNYKLQPLRVGPSLG